MYSGTTIDVGKAYFKPHMVGGGSSPLVEPAVADKPSAIIINLTNVVPIAIFS